jgi:integrase
MTHPNISPAIPTSPGLQKEKLPPHDLHRQAFHQNTPWLHLSESPITPETPFSKAADLWIGSISGAEDIGLGKLRRVRENTEKGYQANIRTLKLFFGDRKLCDVRLDHLARYEAARVVGAAPFIRYRRPQDARSQKGPGGEMLPPKGAQPCPAKSKTVNKEIQVLKRIMRIGGAWNDQQDQLHQQLAEEESDIQRALSPEEQALWLRVARSSERWHLVYFYSELAFATCMSTNEIRSLRLCDIHLDSGTINIPWSGSKNRHRHRSVTIGQPGDLAWHAMEWLLARANRLGSNAPNHYLFPFREAKDSFNPMKPVTASGLKKRWEEVRLASGLKWFRQYDTRHTAITRLAECGEPIAVIMKMAGHISEKMTEHYTHISDRLQLKAMRQVQAARHGDHREAAAANHAHYSASQALTSSQMPATRSVACPTSAMPRQSGFVVNSGSSFFLSSFTFGTHTSIKTAARS